MPPFQIPKNRSKKSQREQLSKVLAFVKYERNIRAAEGCTVMPIPTTNKHMLAITGSPANASNLIKFMCKIGLISPESEKYRFGSRYEKNNYAKTYRYYYDNDITTIMSRSSLPIVSRRVSVSLRPKTTPERRLFPLAPKLLLRM